MLCLLYDASMSHAHCCPVAQPLWCRGCLNALHIHIEVSDNHSFGLHVPCDL